MRILDLSETKMKLPAWAIEVCESVLMEKENKNHIYGAICLFKNSTIEIINNGNNLEFHSCDKLWSCDICTFDKTKCWFKKRS